jgi:hypothetical protein
MNIHVTDLTPTQREVIARHQRFRASIDARAAELKAKKMTAALDALRVVALEAPLSRAPVIWTVSPEAMPAETDPPSPNWFSIIASEPKPRDYPSIIEIQKAVCKHYDVKLADMLSGRRTANIMLPRQIAYYLCKELTPHSLPQIGRRFGGRDHTSILHGVRKVARLLLSNEGLRAEIAALTSILGSAA